MLSQDSEDEIRSRFVFELAIWLWQDELNPRVRCAFGNVLLMFHPGQSYKVDVRVILIAINTKRKMELTTMCWWWGKCICRCLYPATMMVVMRVQLRLQMVGLGNQGHSKWLMQHKAKPWGSLGEDIASVQGEMAALHSTHTSSFAPKNNSRHYQVKSKVEKLLNQSNWFTKNMT